MGKHEIRSALLEWVKETLAVASESDIERYDRGEFAWVAIDNGNAQTRVSIPGVAWSDNFQTRARILFNGKNIVEIAKTWPALLAQADVLVGTYEYGSAHQSLDALLWSCLPTPSFDPLLRKSVVPAFTLLAFDERYSRLEAWIESDHCTFESRVVLTGVQLDDGSYPVPFDDNVIIDRLSENECAELIVPNQPQVWNAEFGGDHTPRFALRIRQTFRKRIGQARESDDEPGKAAQRAHGDRIRTIDRIISALAISSSGAVGLGPMDVRQLSFGERRQRSISPIHIDIFEPKRMLLTATDIATANIIYQNLVEHDHKLPESISMAIRRMKYAMERIEPEDQLLDYMIAAESLFLADGNTTELKYRLALRAAFSLFPENQRNRRLAFDDFKNAYDARSKIAHGSRIDEKKLRIRGKPVTLRQFVNELGDYLRSMLRMVLKEEPDRAFRDWDDLIVGPL